MDWEEDILARELAEKRSRAPGWLDREEKLLEPERVGRGGGSADAGGENVEMTDRVDGRAGPAAGGEVANRNTNEGAELDRAFGGLDIK